MRLSKITLIGISEAFPQPVSVDFETLGPGLITLAGENGAGKSTLIGCVFAALFRQLPGQKRSLYDFCTHPKPEIDLTFSVEGVAYRALHKINPQARQMESYLFDAQGAPLANGKKEAFQEAITKRVGSMALFEASYFSSQKRTGNFLGLERSERKQLFVTELLGLGRLRLISSGARERADEWRRQVLGLEGERKGIDQLLAGTSDIENPEALAAKLDTITAEVEKLESDRGQAEETLAQLRAREVERNTIDSRRLDLSGRAQKAMLEMAEFERALAEDRKILAKQTASGEVTDQVRTLDARIDQLHRQMGKPRRWKRPTGTSSRRFDYRRATSRRNGMSSSARGENRRSCELFLVAARAGMLRARRFNGPSRRGKAYPSWKRRFRTSSGTLRVIRLPCGAYRQTQAG